MASLCSFLRHRFVRNREWYHENVVLIFYVHVRFRGTESSEERLPVSIGDLSDLHVHFFKQQEGEEATETLCKVFIIPRSPVQVLLLWCFNEQFLVFTQ